MSDHIQVKCAKCNVPIKGPAEPKPEDIFACPVCGESDSFENIMQEIADYAREQMADYIMRPAREAARGSKYLKVTENPREKRTYRFVVDLNLN